MVKRDQARNNSGSGEIIGIFPDSGKHGCNQNQSFGLWYLTARTAIGKRARARTAKSLFPKNRHENDRESKPNHAGFNFSYPSTRRWDQEEEIISNLIYDS